MDFLQVLTPHIVMEIKYLYLQQREEAIMEDQRRALRRYNERKAVSDFQKLQ